MSEQLDITNDSDVSIAPTDAAVTVVLDSAVEVIQTFEQGPPGPPGEQGPASTVPGPPGPPGATGNTVLYGAGAPPPGLGVDGNFYVNTTTNYWYGPKTNGVWPSGISLVGPQGVQGIQGIPGNTVLYGPADPFAGNGVDGNFWINTTTHFMFGPKAGGVWPSGISLIGPQGIQGIQGIQGVQGIPGNTVLYGAGDPVAGTGIDGNFYINTSTHFMFGPKAGGAWPAGISLIGPQGIQGIQGPPGAGSPATAVPIIDGVGTVGVSTNFAREDHVHPSDVNARAVRFDAAQGLTAAQQIQARQNVYAAPFDAMAYSGMQTNGAMDIDQEHSGAAVPGPTFTYILDGYRVATAGAVVLTAQYAADAPPGYSSSLKITVTTAVAALGGTDYAMVYAPIEGFRTARLAFGGANAQPVSLGFWTKIHRPGLYSASIGNSADNRFYPFSFTQNVADAWEFKTVTIPGDQVGAWVGGNGIGLKLRIMMACGATYQGAVNAWTAATIMGAVGTTNGVAALTDVFQITGIIMLPGIELPSAARAPFIMRPYDQELLLCQRYFVSLGPSIYCNGHTDALAIPISLPVPMRTAPSLTHPYTDANFTAAGTPGAGQWNLQDQNVATASRVSGSMIFGYLSTTTTAMITEYGVTFSRVASYINADPALAKIILRAQL